MKTKEKSTVYYICAIKNKQIECIKVLEDKGGKNINGFNRTGELPHLYYIDEENIISAVYSTNNKLGRLIKHYGTELHLPEKPKVLTWKDIKETKGYYTIGTTVYKDFEPNKIVFKSVFATSQQAYSAQAAAMISQIREQGKETYGEIVPAGGFAAKICNTGATILVSIKNITNGGLLRFETIKQAELFLENNRELVEEYLKTF